MRVVANTPAVALTIAVGFVPLRPRARCVVARPRVDLPPRNAGERCVCYVRDGAHDLLERLVALGERPLVFAASDPAVPGVDHHPIDREAFVAALASARVVVAAAGAQIVAECGAAGIPLFAVHARDDDAQRLHVVMARAHGLAYGGCVDEIDDAELSRFLAQSPRASTTASDLPCVDEAVAAAVEAL